MSARQYFYHSFPRRNNIKDNQCAHALTILNLMCRDGLLLVPEEVSWADPTQPNPNFRTNAIQRRICFTQLSRNELASHAEAFGSFSLEFDIDILRSLGAIPVIYIPDRSTSNHPHELIGVSLLANLSAAMTVISHLAETATTQHSSLTVDVSFKNGDKITKCFSEQETQAIKDYVNILAISQGIPFHEMRNATMAMASIFYPTENPRYTQALGYYHQREWRIISGAYVEGMPTTDLATKVQAADLIALDERFFSRVMSFADGKFRVADKCHFLKTIQRKHVMTMVNKIIVPEHCVSRTFDLIRQHGFAIPVEVL